MTNKKHFELMLDPNGNIFAESGRYGRNEIIDLTIPINPIDNEIIFKDSIVTVKVLNIKPKIKKQSFLKMIINFIKKILRRFNE